MSSKTALLIDDEPAIHALVRLTMEGVGWRVLTAGNGADGLVIARAEHPDIILLDIVLPDLSGLEVCRQLKSEPDTRPIPIIVLTAMAGESNRQAAFAMGADDYMVKPWRHANLLNRALALLPGGSLTPDTEGRWNEGAS
ncbi:MAG: response regulator transcription factor [Chloroflexota bacterium]